MKKLRNLICILLSALMLLSMSAPAYAYSPADWQVYWQNAAESRSELIMQPGSDESERNFSWLMPAGASECSVLISADPLMLNPSVYKGDAIETYYGDYCAKVNVTGLSKGTTYYYTCVSDNEKSETYSFSTLESDSYTALFVSDVHISEGETMNDALGFENLVDNAKKRYDINMIISAGDQPVAGVRREYQGLTASPTSRSLTFALCIGNHDKLVEYRFIKNVPNEYFGIVNHYQGGDYWFVKGGALFLVINSNNASAVDHRNFVKQAVEKNPDAKWRIAVMHHDLYGGTIAARENENRLLRLLFPPIFDEFDIDLALMGHSHHYSVSDVIYNGKSVKKIENGETVLNAGGTVYVVASSLFRPRENALNYSGVTSLGMDNPFTPLYTILDFSENKIGVDTYNYETNEIFSSFALEKNEEYSFKPTGFFRKLINGIAAVIGTLYAYVDNFTRYSKLKKKGFDVNIFETALKR